MLGRVAMLKVIIYAYMNNIYSCRKIEKALKRDVHFIWLAGYEQPDFITINRFRNRVKDEINNVFTQLVMLLAERSLVSLDVEYIDGKDKVTMDFAFFAIAFNIKKWAAKTAKCTRNG